jgi:predicted aspartyl protease
MGRIIVPVTVANALHPDRALRFDAYVDTGAYCLTLPSAWRDQLGTLDVCERVDLLLANQRHTTGEFCGPVTIRIEGFRPTHGDALFIDMEPVDGQYQPLLGFLTLEAAGVVVDMIEHRLTAVRHYDLRSIPHGPGVAFPSTGVRAVA